MLKIKQKDDFNAMQKCVKEPVAVAGTLKRIMTSHFVALQYHDVGDALINITTSTTMTSPSHAVNALDPRDFFTRIPQTCYGMIDNLYIKM